MTGPTGKRGEVRFGSRWRRRSWQAKVAVCLAAGLVAIGAFQGALYASSRPSVSAAGDAGTVSGLPSTSSQVVVGEPNQVPGGPYDDLKVTVNQTQNLTNQDISISWTGAPETSSLEPGVTFDGNYLQIFECWGDPESVFPEGTSDPGPPPSQCEFGGESSTPSSSYPISQNGYEYTRVLSTSGWSDYNGLDSCTSSPNAGLNTGCQITGYNGLYNDTTDQDVIEPFNAVDGTSVGLQANYGFQSTAATQSFWLNPYYSFNTTNEVDFARTYADGDGTQLFQVDTGLEAPGLGCGQQIQPTASGGDTTPQCWLVVVPRSSPTAENPSNVQSGSVVTSPLTPGAWANRIAVPLGFNPIGSSCSVNAATEGIEGSELASEAVSSWQPALCGQSASTSYSYLQSNDDEARTNLTNPSYGSVGMSVFSDPVDPSDVSVSNPVVYAPLTLSSVVVGFNIERVPAKPGGVPVADEVPLEGTRIATVNLTPRLVAKLLTESYQGEFQDFNATKPAGYGWLQNNPETIFQDPDFLQYNPEFASLGTEYEVDAGTLIVEESSSDAAATLWKWVLADPEARAWLAGTPTPDGTSTGMYVNPNYTTNPNYQYLSQASSGSAFGTPAPENFPKSDTYCESVTGQGDPPIGGQEPRPLCVQDWSPYAGSMKAAAQDAAAANDQAKTTFTPTATSADAAWGSNGPQVPGNYVVMTVTDSASASLYGLQSASLSRAGDDAPAGQRVFVAPTTQSILAGEEAMSPSSVSSVLETNVSTSAANAYPLTMLTYAATTPESLSSSDRASYASFIRYSAQAGQVSGVEPGELPAGYVPLPSDLVSQALAAATTILNPPAIGGASTAAPGGSTGSASTSDGEPYGSSAISGYSPLSSSTAPASTSTSTSTSASTPTSTANPIRVRSAALADAETRGFSIGSLRWLLPAALVVGLIAGLLGGFLGLFDLRYRRRKSIPHGDAALTEHLDRGSP